MSYFVVLLCFSFLAVDAFVKSGEPRGIQLRLTQKGLDYTITEAVKILQEDVRKIKINDFSGDQSGIKFSARNLHLKSFNIGSSSLRPEYKRGLIASVGGISLSLEGEFKYQKKIGWIKISDTVNIDAKARDVSFSLSLNFGRTSTGHPTVAVNWCNAKVDSLDLHFSGSRASWLYNLLDSIIERMLKGKLSDIMCKAAKESINKRATEEMAEFEIRKALDDFSILDYSLSAPPAFDYGFMDVFIRGEFLAKKNPSHHSSLPVPSFEAAADNSKMLYFWLTDYTINTAGEVYHNSGILSLDITQKSKVPWIVKSYLNTHNLGVLIPELSRRYPKRPIQLNLHSYKAPKVEINKGSIHLLLYAAADFKVVLANGKLVDVFTLNMDITAAVSPLVTDKIVKGQLDNFKLSLTVGKSEIGPIKLPTRLPLIQSLVQAAIIKNAKAALNKGFPLPNLDEVHLTNPGIVIMPNVIRIATDCVYIRKK